MKLIFFVALSRKRSGPAVVDVTLSGRDLIQCPVSDGELLLTPGFKATVLVKGWSLHSCQQPSTLTIIDKDRFPKDFVVGFCVYRWSHVGLVLVCAEIHQQQRSPHSLFLHVCSMCFSHISANIYTECKTLLISFPCLLSCSFSHTDLFLC